MPDMFAYLHGFGKGSSRDLSKSVIIVTASEGSTVEVANAGGYGKTLPVIVKNLLDIDAYKAKVGTNAQRGSVAWSEDGLWLQATGDDCFTIYGPDYFNIPAKPNTKYTISWDVTGSANKDGYVYAFAYGSDGSEIKNFNAINTAEKLTFTTPEGTAKFGFRFGVQTAGQNAFYTNIQIEEGEKTDYARYNSCMFEDVPNGWTKISIVGGSHDEVVWVSRADVYYVTFRLTPEFTYTGDYEIVDDNDNPISDFASWKSHWKIRFLTSGVFTVVNKYGWNGFLDAFYVGGGGGSRWGYKGGAGGGYTKTIKGIPIEVGVPYQITVGAGGAVQKNGGSTSAFGDTVNGGVATKLATNDGSPGGSGGGASGGAGGSDGSSGGSTSSGAGGAGQGSTTREFGDPKGKLYAGGGGGGGSSSAPGGEGGGAPGGQSAKDNTGGGAGGALNSSSSSGYNVRGGSGIVVIRDSRA